MKILVLCVLLARGLKAKPTLTDRIDRQDLLSIAALSEEYPEFRPEVWFDRREISGNDASFYGTLTELTEQAKRLSAREDLSTQLQPQTQPRLVAKSGCACETQYEIKDLGDGHYPRYLTASRCKPKTCQSKFHSCRLLDYMVHVLRRRDGNEKTEDRYPEDDALPETPLPESLRRQWQLKPMSVAVACVPTTRFRQN